MITYEEAVRVLKDLKNLAKAVDAYADSVIEDYRWMAEYDNREIIETLMKLDLE